MDNDTAKKLTDQIAKDMLAKFASPEFQTFIKSVNDATDTGTFEIVISTDNIDRHGEIVDQKGIDFTNYMTNPVVLWGHNHNQIPVGVTDEIYTRVVGSQVQTVAKGRFAPHEFAQTLRQLFDAGMLKTSSIGFIPLEYNGNVITKSELLEWSFVSIPANPYALALGKSGFNVAELVAKGVVIEETKTGDDINNDEIEKPDDAEITPVEEKPVDEVVETDTTETVDDTASVQENETEEKGAIADTVAEQDMRKLKWDKFAQLDKLYWAFCDVYFDDETPVEDFETLKAEFVALLGGATQPESRLVAERDFDEVKSKHVHTVKAGRVLSSTNRDKIVGAISALEEVLSIADASETTDAKAIDDTDGVLGKNADVEAVQDFLTLRKGVQSLAGVLNDVLKTSKQNAEKYTDVRPAN